MHSIPSCLTRALGVALGLIPSLAVAQNEEPAQEGGGPVETVYAARARAGDPAPGAFPARPDVQRILGSTCGLHDDAGRLLGLGPTYKVWFDAEGPSFIPALGEQAPRTEPLRFRLDSVGRAAGVTVSTKPVAHPVQDGMAVRYARGACVERYDVLVEGVEQSFVFDTLPAGNGDLVVRGHFADFEYSVLTQDETAGITFDLDGHGGVRIGAVTGVDADGRQAAGTIRYEANGALELRLPSDFVDAAKLPLTVDPLIGSTINVATLTNERDPDIAYDATNSVYCVAWERRFSSSNIDIRAQRFNVNGTPAGPLIGVYSGTTNAFDPRVANVAREDAFVIIYVLSSDVWARALIADPSSAAQSAAFNSSNTSDLVAAPDIGGEATSVDNEAIAVWWNLTASSVQATQVSVTNNAGALTVSDFGTITVASGFSDALPAISKSGGTTGNHMIVWQRSVGSESVIRAAVYTRNLGVISSLLAVSDGSVDSRDPDVDGDGANWVVVWEVEESASNPDDDIAARGFQLSAGVVAASTPIVVVEGDPADDEQNASVCWLGNSCLIAYSDEVVSPDYDALVTSIDPFDCELCEFEQGLETGSRDSDFITMASRFSGNGIPSNDALIVWESNDPAGAGANILGRRWEADDGSVFNLGGGCGSGGEARATCANNGTMFDHRLRGGPAGASAVLVFSLDRIDAPCGACLLLPNPFTGLALAAGSTDSGGNASFAMPIPATTQIVGLTFIDQWITAGTACSDLSGDLSNAIEVTIQ